MIFGKKYNYLIILIMFLSKTTIANSNLLLMQTSRMKSTAGAGVASFLIDESSILNPAPLAFFSTSSIYYSKTTVESLANNDIGNWSVAATDTQGTSKGSFSYFNSHIGEEKHKQWAIAIAQNLGKQSSMGISYRRNNISTPNYGAVIDYISIGFLHILSSNFSLGLVFNDPFSNSEQTKLTTGFQYVYQDAIIFMVDIGANYRREMDKTFFYKIAIQVKIMSSFYLRYGIAKDDFRLTKTNGIGIGWVGPKMNMDISYQTVKDQSGNMNDFKETSFSLAYKF